MKKRLWYFAYGSNLVVNQFIARVGEPLNIEKYNLKDYQLDFNVVGYSAFANIKPKKGSIVEGVLYEVHPQQMDDMDKHEALYSKNFFVDENIDGIIFAYVGKEHFVFESLPKFSRPSIDYLKRIIRGCEMFELDNTKRFVEQVLTSVYSEKEIKENERWIRLSAGKKRFKL